MVIKRKIIEINGKKVEVDAFETSLILGNGKEEKALERLLEEDEIESEIIKKLREIDNIAKEYQRKNKDIWFYYKIGKVLQFVDEKQSISRLKIWERIADNLRPDVFFGKPTPPKNSKKYPQIMYLLAKQKYENVNRVTWSHWFEILQYPRIYDNEMILESLLQECEDKNFSSERLRKRVQELNREL